ncbi:hypothetical protein EYE40_11375 [Glaciihabitans arcticus]|uniref:Uncharacterized protein n=1 Tax=Glaciihabitans arcticus TaxID=2668039 RepID=A0A4Q9GZW7_9MICO|nr:hypothetical protein [Glaciihabitans arcticus]TBN57950.1 hypothetical protein EYE40_11375 [Glaciihabitans arcticus]
MKSTTGKVAALLVVGALTLSGCSLIGEVGQVGGSMAEEAALNAELDALRGRIIDLDGVTDATATLEIEGDYEFYVEFAVTADELSEPVAAQIVEEIGDAFSAGTLAKQNGFVGLEAADDSSLSWNTLALVGQDLSGEVEYWFALQEAFGSPLRVGLYGEDQAAGDAPYLSSIATYAPGATPDWDSLRAVPDTTGAARTWQLYGVDVVGSLPPEPVTDVLADLTSTLGESFGMQWDGPKEALTVAVYSAELTTGTPVEQTPAWDALRDAVALLAVAPVRSSTFSYYGEDQSGKFAVHLGVCEGGLRETPLDASFLAALTAAGALDGVEAAPGICLPA